MMVPQLRYQAQLQKNLMYLAAIADAQPPTPTIPPQMSSHPAMQQAGYYMQHPQVSTKAPQPGISPPKMPMQFNSPHSIQDPQQLHQQHQQAMQGQMGVRPMGHNNVMHPMHHTETTVGAGGSGGPPSVGPNESRGGSNQRTSDAGTTGAVGHGSGDRKEAI